EQFSVMAPDQDLVGTRLDVTRQVWAGPGVVPDFQVRGRKTEMSLGETRIECKTLLVTRHGLVGLAQAQGLLPLLPNAPGGRHGGGDFRTRLASRCFGSPGEAASHQHYQQAENEWSAPHGASSGQRKDDGAA